MTDDDSKTLHDRLMEFARPMVEQKQPIALALAAVLEEHAPSLDRGCGVDSRQCPDHNPTDHPDLYRAQFDFAVFEACPTCDTHTYDTCSSWDCTSCDYPCATVEAIQVALEAPLAAADLGD